MFLREHKKDQSLKSWQWVVLAAMIIAALGYRLYSLRWKEAAVIIGNQQLKTLVADTYAHQVKGLSDKNDMGKYQGMLFVFNNRGQHAIVMRSMLFPLDVVWLDDGRIVDIAPNLQPDPAKTEAELTPYFARAASNAVLELPAGFAAKNGLKIGDKVEYSMR